MIPIYEEMCKAIYTNPDKIFGIRIDFCQTVIFKNSNFIFDKIRDILGVMVDGVYRIFLTHLPSSPEISVSPYPLEDEKDIYRVHDILVIKKGLELTLLIPENDKEFDNIKCRLTFF